MTPHHATRRPTDRTHLDGDVPDPPSDLLNQPWIDAHNHAHTLSWGDRERFALSGCEAMVVVASGSHWTPYRPVRSEDVRYLWDDAVNRLAAIERNHFFDARLALGVQTRIRVEDPDPLVEALEGYCELQDVVAIGETGVTPAQHVERWPADEQRAVVEAQMAVADRHDLPVVLHTPNPTGDGGETYRPGFRTPGYERNTSLDAEPVIEADDPALEAVRMDVAAAREVGFPEERIVASHVDENNVPYLAEETGCHLSFTIGQPWLTGVSARTVADAIDAYGPERIMLDTDSANVLRSDVFAIKRAIVELYRLGVDEGAIRQVVRANPRDVFGFPA